MDTIKDLVWTDEYVSRFWNYMSTKNNSNEDYFTFVLKDGIVNFIENFTELNDKEFLDYGCGKGFLFEKLLGKNAACYGIDFSEDSIDYCNREYSNNENWKGASLIKDDTIDFPDNSFDIITCIEVIEHILDDYLDNTFSELYRVLKPGGILLFTTPNDEDLEKGMYYCPKSDVRFHWVQHVRSWNRSALLKKLESHQFKNVFTEGVHLLSYQEKPFETKRFFDSSLRSLYYEIEYFFSKRFYSKKRYWSYLLKRHNTKKNLVAVVTK